MKDNLALVPHIAWLSLVLLAAGFGPTQPLSVKSIWRTAGLFGLTTAVGLAAVKLDQSGRTRRSLQVLNERRLGQLASISTDGTNVVHGMSRLMRQLQHCAGDRRSEPRATQPWPVKVSVFKEGAPQGSPDTFIANLRDLSPSGLSFVHAVPHDRDRAVVTFEMPDGSSTLVVLALTWSKQEADNQYASGGRVLEVINEPHQA